MCRSILGGGGVPAPVALPEAQPLPQTVQEGDAGPAAARDDERRRRLQAAAANNTLVTGGQGVLGQANTGGGSLYGQ